MIRSGRPSLSVAQSRPKRAIVPGVKLSTTTSAQSTSRRASSRPSSVERSSARPSFEELKLAMNCARSMCDSPSLNGGAARSTSMRVEDSTWTAVAPWSASALLIMGPTPTQAKSATFSPSNGWRRRRRRRRQRGRRLPLLVEQRVAVAERRRRAPQLDRRAREARKPTRVRAAIKLAPVAASLQLGVGGNVGHRIDGRDQQVVRARRDPSAHASSWSGEIATPARSPRSPARGRGCPR